MLTVHRSEHAAVLADELGRILRDPLPDTFTPEVVAVPAKGVERWLAQRLSTALGARSGDGQLVAADGVSANISFPSPTRLVDEVLAAADGLTAKDDPWTPQRMLWALLAVLDRSRGAPDLAVLARHLGDGTDVLLAGRRYKTAEQLRDLFRSYGTARPTMLVDWAAGRDTDGAGSPLPPDLMWQASLWRRLRHELDAPSPAERLGATCDRLRADPGLTDLPARLSLFGPTRLTTAQRAVLAALGTRRDVHLWCTHASPAMWTTLEAAEPPLRRSQDRSAALVRHPLLAGLSRDSRELQLLLRTSRSVHHPPPGQPTATLLAALQRGLREDAPPERASPAHDTTARADPGATTDTSVQVHACHGPARQVEVLREALLHLFQQDSALEPRDVLVTCPDVETYAPLLRAAFGHGSTGRPDGGAEAGSGTAAGQHAHPGLGLRVRLADRALRQTNPLLDTVAGLLELAGGRVTASAVLDLAASEPVRRQFGFSDDDLERLRDWADTAGVRWGIGASQRAAVGLGALGQNTWRAGLDRILLGVAADESDLHWLGLALPLDDVDSSDIELTGRLAELVDRLDGVLLRLQGSQPLERWVSALVDGLDLLTDVAPADLWQLAQARRELADAAEHGRDVQLRLPDVRAMLDSRLAGRPTRASFRTGELTVCTMVPMRSVPHRVVALLGLDDGVFPRAAGVDGDDVLQRDPCLGERDVRSEDRQLLLDAVTSAGSTLLLLYTGADPVTGATRPPAVPLGELIDTLHVMTGRDVVSRHPLQPFDARNLLADAPFSFDRQALQGARAAAGTRRPPRPFLVGPLSPLASDTVPGDVSLGDLVALLVHPAKGFLAQRLGVRLPGDTTDGGDALPADLGPLQTWDIGERMLTARLAGVDAAAFRQAEYRRGTLPPGSLGLSLLARLEAELDPVVQAALAVWTGPPRRREVAVQVGGRWITGTVGGLHGDASGAVLLRASYSRLGPKQRLTAWLQVLALGAGAQAVTIGRSGGGRPGTSRLTAPADAHDVIADLLALYDEGLRAPLPVGTDSSAEYAARRHRGDSAEQATEAARASWTSRFGDGADRDLAYVLGPDPFDQLLTDRVPGPEPTRFGALALRLWSPLLAAESP